LRVASRTRYYDILRASGRRSARIVVPHVMDVLAPRSVVDVGCGTGTWLAAFREAGVEDVLGIDGEHMTPELLEIPADRYLAKDLAGEWSVDRTFDLAVSLEVAEHLPPTAAEGFVSRLTALAPAVLFSAAIPLQGGGDHPNEQWPRYWADLFERRGHVLVDWIRPRVWENDDVEIWYAQNTVMFATTECMDAHPELAREYELRRGSPLSIVHPRLYLDHHYRLSEAMKNLGRAGRTWLGMKRRRLLGRGASR
jgi:SAM-dependent methyltransferase